MKNYQKGDRIGQFVILQEIPGGGMGRVYTAKPLNGNDHVVLKVARGEQADFLKDEAECLPALHHPHIIRILPAVEIEGHVYYLAREPSTEEWYIVLEYLEGGSLKDRFRQERKLDVEEAVTIIEQIGSALDYAHCKGTIHQDIKPSNVLFRSCLEGSGGTRGQAVISDFGIAVDIRRIRAGEIAGTLPYMSPEQARVVVGERINLDHRVDLYSLGVLLYEMLTGRHPVSGKGREEILQAIINEPPIPPSQFNSSIRAAIERVILKALEKDPSKRFASAQEMVNALRDVAEIGSHGKLPAKRNTA